MSNYNENIESKSLGASLLFIWSRCQCGMSLECLRYEFGACLGSRGMCLWCAGDAFGMCSGWVGDVFAMASNSSVMC